MTELAIEAVQEVQAVPVLEAAGSRALARPTPGAAQALIVAAGGFVAGVAVVGLATRRRGRAVGRRGGGAGRFGRGRAAGGRKGRGELVKIVGTRSLLVDVHLLDARR